MRQLSLLLLCLAAACAKPTPIIIYLTPPPTATSTATLTPIPPTATRTPIVTSTPDPLRFPTQALEETLATPVVFETLLPGTPQTITVANATQVQELARWGLGKINAYGYDPAGRWLAIGTTLGLYLHEATTYATAITIPTATPVQALAFAPNGQMLLAALQDGSLVQWDTTTWLSYTLVAPLTPERVTYRQLLIAPNNRYAALTTGSTFSSFEFITVWDLVQQRKVLQQMGRGPVVFLESGEFVFRSTGNLYQAFNLENTDIQIWELPPEVGDNFALDTAGNVMAQTPAGAAYFVRGAAVAAYTLLFDVRFTPGPPLAATCAGSVVYNPTPIGLALDAPRNLLAVLLLDGTLQLYQADQTGAQLRAELPGFASLPVFAPGAPGGAPDTFLARDKTTQQLGVWRTADGALLHRFSEYVAEFTALSFSPDGTLLAAASPQAGAWVWRVADGKRLWTLGQGVTSVAFKNNNFLATGDVNGTLSVWDMRAGTLQIAFQAHTARINQLLFKHDISLFSTGDDCVLRLWNWRGGTPLAELVLGNGGTAETLAFEPQNTLVVASQDYGGILKAWKIFGQSPLSFTPLDFTFPPNYRQPTFWAGGGFFLAHGAPGVQLGEISPDGLQMFPFRLGELNERQATHLRISPALELIAGASNRDFQVLLWSLREGQGLVTLPGHTEALTDLIFEPNNTLIATASTDGTVRLWGVRP